MDESNENRKLKYFLSWERIYSNYSKKDEEESLNKIDPLDSDHMRILSSSSFRRLQDKTQLFPLEKNDYARTRLTHSCEVAATAKSIGDCVLRIMRTKDKVNSYVYKESFIRLSDIAYLSSLLHDIGNPPFGHYGEEIIREYFHSNWDKLEYRYNSSRKKLRQLFPVGSQEYWDFCGFDGNSQALRVITKLERYGHDPYGLNLTTSVISGIIKYPFDSKTAITILDKYKFGYFKSELEIINELKKRNLYIENTRSAVPYVVEAADDISMAISDFEDGIKKGCINIHDIIQYDDKGDATVIDFINDFSTNYNENAKNQNEEPMIATATRMLNSLRNDLIRDVSSGFVQMLMSWNYPYPSQLPKPELPKPLIKQCGKYPVIKMLKDIVENKVYQDEQIVAPELKGQLILSTLLDKMLTAVLNLSIEELQSSNAKNEYSKVSKLLSKNYIDGFVNEVEKSKSFDSKEEKEVYLKLRLVIDQLSGMTDSYAEQVYRKIS